jgi:hypothetical protein
MFRKAFVAALAALIACAPLAARAQTPSCPLCDQVLVLSPSQWSCLVRRLPQMQTAPAPTVFFSLSPEACDTSEVRSVGMVLIPPSIGGAAGEPGRVYRLTREQVACLAAKAPYVRAEGSVVFEFASQCGAR